MPRYLVERSFPEGLAIPLDEGGAKTMLCRTEGVYGHAPGTETRDAG
jgi:hypothetical protein